MQTTEWYDWAIKQEITYKLAHLYTYGEGVEQNLDKGAQYYKELENGYNWGNRAQYQLGRMAEKRHNYIEAMWYYRKILIATSMASTASTGEMSRKTCFHFDWRLLLDR